MENKQILDSWKEISDYLKRDIKTCQRWEKELSLPVRRLEDSPKAHVFAYKEELDRWLDDTLKREQSSWKRFIFFGQKKTKKFIISALAVFVLVVAGVMIWQLLPNEEELPSPTDKPSLAVLYFENNTGDKSLDNWESGITDLIITDLLQSKYISVLTGNRIFSILKKLNLLEVEKYSTEDLINVANEGKVDNLVTGSFIKAGEDIIITSLHQKPRTGEAIRPLKVVSRGEEEIALKVDEITKRIKLDMNLSHKQIADDIDKDVREITTSSSEAYKYYNEGIRFLNRRDPGEAVLYFRRAVTADPEFAMAYIRMGRCYNSLNRNTDSIKCIQKAYELSNRVSDRERLWIQARFYFLSLSTYDKAVKSLNRCLELYPGDVDACRQLAFRSVVAEEWDRAIEYSDIVIRSAVEMTQPHQYKAHALRGKGLFDRGKEVLEYYRDHINNNATVHWYLAIHHLLEKKHELALDEVNKAIFRDPTIYIFFPLKAKILMGLGDFISAEQELQRLQEVQDFEANCRSDLYLYKLYLLQGKFARAKAQLGKGIDRCQKFGEKGRESDRHHDLAYLHLRLGNFGEALQESSRAWSLHIGRSYLQMLIRLLHQKGLVQLKLKQVQDAQRTADDLNNLIEPIASFAPKMKCWYYNLAGMIELDQENFSGAIAYFKNALSLLSFPPPSYFQDFHGLFIEPLASAYFMTGDLENARKEYERIISLSFGRHHYGDIYALSFYMLGKIFEQKGDKAKAIEHYEKFLDLWKDADPGIAEVEDAKKRLAGLNTLPQL